MSWSWAAASRGSSCCASWSPPASRAFLVTDADLGAGQTLHSHGLVNSGTGLLTGGLRSEIHEVTVPYLR